MMAEQLSEAEFRGLCGHIAETEGSLLRGFRIAAPEQHSRLAIKLKGVRNVLDLYDLIKAIRQALREGGAKLESWIPKGNIVQVIRACCDQRYKEHDIEYIVHKHGGINGLLVLSLGTLNQTRLFPKIYGLPRDMIVDLAEQCGKEEIGSPYVSAWIEKFNKSKSILPPSKDFLRLKRLLQGMVESPFGTSEFLCDLKRSQIVLLSCAVKDTGRSNLAPGCLNSRAWTEAQKNHFVSKFTKYVRGAWHGRDVLDKWEELVKVLSDQILSRSPRKAEPALRCILPNSREAYKTCIQNRDEDGPLTEMMTEDNSAQLSCPNDAEFQRRQFWNLRYEVQKLVSSSNEQAQCDISVRLKLLRRLPKFDPDTICEVKTRQVVKILWEQSRVLTRDKHRLERRSRDLLRRLDGTMNAYRRLAQQ